MLTALPAAAQENVPWGAPDYTLEFKYFQETSRQTEENWAALPQKDREYELLAVKEDSRIRNGQIRSFYAKAMEKWDMERLRLHIYGVKEDKIRLVTIWLGEEKAAALKRKLTVTRALTDKASRAGLDENDTRALTPYLLDETIAALKAFKISSGADSAAQNQPGAGGHGETLNNLTSAGASALSNENLTKLYDGGSITGGEPVVSGAARASASERPAAPTVKAGKAAFAMPKIAAPDGTKSAAKENKSSGLTSDAYGVTVYINGNSTPQTFRQGGEASAAIRKLPDGSINKVIFYGHGAPGLQTVGSFELDSDNTPEILKGKMSAGGLVQFEGCNTASIGEKPSINPLFGLSIGMRRLLYFSLPYFQERLHGQSADEARKTWEKVWNQDLARDTSVKLRGSVVCGNRTFGLVPGRLPVITTILGNQEATTPGYVLSKKACYLNGAEVKVP
ncbi:MAG: hypothetical protein NTX59_04865 [Elusimicrobia bacterium]|nr:hypothetical protein [Elusimicrobiota bacterium]